MELTWENWINRRGAGGAFESKYKKDCAVHVLIKLSGLPPSSVATQTRFTDKHGGLRRIDFTISEEQTRPNCHLGRRLGQDR